MLRLTPAMLLLALLTGAAQATVQESIAHDYYEFTAAEGQPLLPPMNRASPFRQDGQVYHAFTQWQLAWHFRWYEAAGGTCRITSAQVELTGQVTMPRLAGGNPAQRQALERYNAPLLQHEMGHFAIGREAAIAIDRMLPALPAMSSCAQLEKTANESAVRLQREYQAKERGYDNATGHGRTQGVNTDLLKYR